jgi:hypothetical protein
MGIIILIKIDEGLSVMMDNLSKGIGEEIEKVIYPECYKTKTVEKLKQSFQENGYSKQEAEMLKDMIIIKEKVNAFARAFNKLPSEIDQVTLQDDLIQDYYRKPYYYFHKNKTIIMSSAGSDSILQFNNNDINKMFKEKDKDIFRKEDDFAIKFVIDTTTILK